MDAYTGEIRVFSGSYVPRDWRACDGSSLPVAEYSALFSLIGLIYGGSGPTFSLPNLNGRLSIGAGQGPGRPSYALGEAGGQETVALTSANLPVHTHVLSASRDAATATAPSVAATFAATAGSTLFYDDLSQSTGPNANYNPLAVGVTGSDQAHDNVMPCVGMTYCICVDGIYPDLS